MTDLLSSDLAAPSDAELISSVRGGDVAAYGDLFARHRDAANRLARQLVRGPDADDLVSEAFAKVLTVLQGGGGPDVAFRAYLLTAVRRLHVDKMRAGAKVQTSDDMSFYDPGVPFQDTAVAAFESGAAAKAFATLPERWQLVLWHLEVEGQKPADIAPLLGMSANSVSALAYRAREGLRQAFLSMHLSDISDTDCRWVNEHLGAFVRKGLSNRDSTKVQAHLDGCRRCTAMYLELTDVNSNLAGIIAPLLLGAAATGYLASSGATAGGLGLLGLVGRVRDVVVANTGAATAGAVAAGVAAVATAGVMLVPHAPERVTAVDEPVTATTPAAPAAPTGGEPTASPSSSEKPERREVPDEPVTSPAAVVPVVLPEASPSSLPVEDQTAPATEAPTATPSDEPTPGTLGFEGPVTFDGDNVSFSVSGEPLPPTILLRLVSDPTGVEFGGDGGSCTTTSATTATCSTAALARGSAYQRGSALAARVFTDTIPLRVPGDQPETAVGLTISVPGVDETDVDASRTSTFQVKGKGAGSTPSTAPEPEPVLPTTAPPVPVVPPVDPPTITTPPVTPPVDPPVELTANVSMTDPTPAAPLPDADGRYQVRTVLTGVAGLPYVRLTVSSAASPVAGSSCLADPEDPQTLLCTAPTEGMSVDLLLAVESPVVTPTPLTISVAGPPEYRETDTNDNARTVDLQPAPLPSADAGVVVVEDVNGNSGRGTVTATVSANPDVPVTLTVTYDADSVKVELPSACEATATGAICSVADGDAVELDVDLVDRSGRETSRATLTFAVTAPGHTDPNDTNDTQPVTIERTFPSHDR
jgi:RNA polymerase sigma factor (sigma-70 family)